MKYFKKIGDHVEEIIDLKEEIERERRKELLKDDFVEESEDPGYW